MMKRLAIFVPLLMFIGFVALALFGLGKPTDRTIESQMVGQKIPTFELAGLDDAHPGLSNEDLAQGTVTLVNIFASWCLPCIAEAPTLGKLADAGVVIHAIAIRDAPEDVQRFLTKHGDPYRRVGMDHDGRTQIAFGSSGVPETFLIDGTGTIRRQYIGEIRADQVDDVLAAIAEVKR